MNDADIKNLKALRKMPPSLDVFKKMVQILKGAQEKTANLQTTLDTILVEVSETTKVKN